MNRLDFRRREPSTANLSPEALLRRAEALEHAGQRDDAQALRRQAEEALWPDGFWGKGNA